MPDPLTLVAFAFILGAVIFIHESGHYFVAKALGIKVEVFSLGFGPKLLRWPRGGTEYCISAIPLGGYVKMLGENPDESLRGTPEEFLSRRKIERFLVLVMGATLNIVLAIVLTAGINVHGVREPAFVEQPAVIGKLEPDRPAAKAGLQARDEILAVDGTVVPTWRDMQIQIALNPDKPAVLRIRRDGKVEDVRVDVLSTEREGIGTIGIEALQYLQVGEVEEGSAAQRGGVEPGDVLVSAGGTDLRGEQGIERLAELVREQQGTLFPLSVRRGNRTVDLTLAPHPGDKKLGMALSFEATVRRYGPIEAVWESLRTNMDQAGLLFLTLKKLIAGQLSPRTLSGPIDIYRLTGEHLRVGWIYYFSFMSLVSLQLGVINLLPIPILDGGHIFILFIEGLIRRDLSMKIKERVMQFGFILLLLIMGGVIYLDVYKNFFIQ